MKPNKLFSSIQNVSALSTYTEENVNEEEQPSTPGTQMQSSQSTQCTQKKTSQTKLGVLLIYPFLLLLIIIIIAQKRFGGIW